MPSEDHFAQLGEQFCSLARLVARPDRAGIDPDDAEALVTAGVTGIMAIELFESGGALIVNEIATRPHNSGHYSIEGSVTSQFEQHLRAILDWPLGETALNAPHVVTVNILGPRDGSDPVIRRDSALAVPGVHLHFYGKGARPGRKLGHVTALGSDLSETRDRAWQAAAILTGEERTVR